MSPDTHPLYDECPVCGEPIWAEETQILDGGIHSECYADQLDAMILDREEQEETTELLVDDDRLDYFCNWRFRG